MRKKRIQFLGLFLSLALLLGLFSTSAFAAEAKASSNNLITNPGFEDGFENWIYTAGTTLDTAVSHSGEQSAKLTLAAGETQKTPSIAKTGIPVKTGDSYELRFWYKAVASESNSGTFRILFSAGSDAFEVPFTATGEWTLFRTKLTVEKTGSTSVLVIGLDNFIGSVYIDDIFLSDGNVVENFSFEDGLKNWDVVNPGGMQIAATSMQAQEGASSLLIGGKQTTFNSYVKQAVPIAGAGYYRLRGNAKAAYNFTGSGVVMKLEALDGAGKVVASAQTQSGTGIVTDWGRLECRLLVPDGAVKLNIKIGSLNSDCVFLADNIQLLRIGDVPSDNLLTNNSFESDLAGWNNYGNAYAFSTTSQFHSGTKAMSMSYFANEGLNKYIAQTYDVVIRGKVNFSVWIKTDANLTGAGAALFIDAVDANGNVLKTVTSQTVSNTNGQWQQVSVSMDMPAGTKQVTTKIAGIYCTGVFYADDAVLTYVN